MSRTKKDGNYYFYRYDDIASELRKHCLAAPKQKDAVWSEMEKQLISALRSLHILKGLAKMLQENADDSAAT
jgi:hypothetical protein